MKIDSTDASKLISYLANSNISESKFIILKDILQDDDTCTGCVLLPAKGENYPMECGECKRFYADGFTKT